MLNFYCLISLNVDKHVEKRKDLEQNSAMGCTYGRTSQSSFFSLRLCEKIRKSLNLRNFCQGLKSVRMELKTSPPCLRPRICCENFFRRRDAHFLRPNLLVIDFRDTYKSPPPHFALCLRALLKARR